MCNYTSALTCFLWFQSNHSLVIICHSFLVPDLFLFIVWFSILWFCTGVQNHTRIYEDAFDHMHLVSWWLFRALCCCSSITEFIVSLESWMQRNSGWLEKFGRISLNTMKNYHNYMIYVCMDYWYFPWHDTNAQHLCKCSFSFRSLFSFTLALLEKIFSFSWLLSWVVIWYLNSTLFNLDCK